MKYIKLNRVKFYIKTYIAFMVLCAMVLDFNQFSCVTLTTVPFVALLYVFFVKKKSVYFSGFLYLYSLDELLSLIMDGRYALKVYFIGNGFYILSLVFLLVFLKSHFPFIKTLKKHLFHFLILLLLTISVAYLLSAMGEGDSGQDEYTYIVRIIETTLNVLPLMAISFAYLNYQANLNLRAAMFLFGCIGLEISDLLFLAFYYIYEAPSLSYLGSFCVFFSFIMFLMAQFYRNKKRFSFKYI